MQRLEQFVSEQRMAYAEQKSPAIPRDSVGRKHGTRYSFRYSGRVRGTLENLSNSHQPAPSCKCPLNARAYWSARFDRSGGEKELELKQPERQNGPSRAEPERGDRTRQSEQRQNIQWRSDDQ